MAQRRRSEPDDRNTESGRTAPVEPVRNEAERDATNEEISARAYELYEQRGAEHGRDWDDWLQAEKELQSRRHTPGPTPS